MMLQWFSSLLMFITVRELDCLLKAIIWVTISEACWPCFPMSLALDLKSSPGADGYVLSTRGAERLLVRGVHSDFDLDRSDVGRRTREGDTSGFRRVECHCGTPAVHVHHEFSLDRRGEAP